VRHPRWHSRPRKLQIKRSIQKALKPHFNMQLWKTDPRIVKGSSEIIAAPQASTEFGAAQR